MRNWRAVLVAVVFLTSLAALAASTGMIVWGATDEVAARDRVQRIAQELADSEGEAMMHLPLEGPIAVLPEPDNRRLASITEKVLASQPDVDAGYYLGPSDQFVGTMLTHQAPSPPSPIPSPSEKDAKHLGKKVSDKKKPDPHREGANSASRRDPPPLETAMIRQLATTALSLKPGMTPIIEVRDVGPSRVALAAVPVGSSRPSRMAAWAMIRLTGPEQQKARLDRLRFATALSLAGVLLALGLAVGLVQSLRLESRRRVTLSDELRKAEHLATLGRMLAGVAHEVRNPLAAIRSTVQLWERLPEQSRTPESFAAVVGAVDRLNDLVGRLLLFARAGHERRRPVDLNAIIAETLELVRARAETQGVTVASDLASNLPLLDGAAPALGQVVMNLIGNALQAMPTGGTLTCCTALRAEGQVELTIADTGPGVPAELRDKVFEPFVTTRTEGTGLGLALCREVARQHGGDVILDRSDSGGATFRLILPLAGGAKP